MLREGHTKHRQEWEIGKTNGSFIAELRHELKQKLYNEEEKYHRNITDEAQHFDQKHFNRYR